MWGMGGMKAKKRKKKTARKNCDPTTHTHLHTCTYIHMHTYMHTEEYWEISSILKFLSKNRARSNRQAKIYQHQIKGSKQTQKGGEVSRLGVGPPVPIPTHQQQ